MSKFIDTFFTVASASLILLALAGIINAIVDLFV